VGASMSEAEARGFLTALDARSRAPHGGLS
jgi:hypothetical protein